MSFKLKNQDIRQDGVTLFFDGYLDEPLAQALAFDNAEYRHIEGRMGSLVVNLSVPKKPKPKGKKR